jgi:hypothetical protein
LQGLTDTADDMVDKIVEHFPTVMVRQNKRQGVVIPPISTSEFLNTTFHFVIRGENVDKPGRTIMKKRLFSARGRLPVDVRNRSKKVGKTNCYLKLN